HVRPYVVEVVPPPEVKQVVLDSRYPDYTGLNRQTEAGGQRTANELKGAQISLPMQTDFVMNVKANKPLRQARIEGDAGQERWEIEIAMGSGESSATITLKSQDGLPQRRLALPLSAASSSDEGHADPAAFSIPFVLASDGATRLPELLRTMAES